MRSVMPYVTVWERRPRSAVLLFRDVGNAFGRHQDFYKQLGKLKEINSQADDPPFVTHSSSFNHHYAIPCHILTYKHEREE